MSFLFFGMHALLHGPQDPNKLNYATIINIISKCCVNPSLQINVLQNDREFLVGQVNEKDQIISQVSFSHWSRSNDQIYLQLNPCGLSSLQFIRFFPPHLLGGFECISINGFYDRLELYLWRESVSMVNDGFIVWSVPAIH